MRDPMNWAFPLFRAFGIPVKVHVFFVVITLGLFLRQYLDKDNVVAGLDLFLFTIVLLFGIVLLHEFGHCFGGRAVGGEATEILIWPLGGLAFVDVPHSPRAHLITVAAGPAVNLAICILTAVVVLGAGFVPKLNPISNPYVCEMSNYRDGRTYTSTYGVRLYKPGTAEEVKPTLEQYVRFVKPGDSGETAVKPAELDRALAPTWLVWVQRTFWLSWVMLLFNLVPAYPLDGGQLLQGVIWARSNHRQGTTVACYSGYVCGLIFFVVSIAANESLFMGLSLFMMFTSYTKLAALDSDDGVFGYDFSAGYTSLERDDPPPPKPRKQNFVRRWLQARAVRRMQREIEEQQRDDERMDQLLDKIAKFGKGSLTDEESRFMQRVSARYRNR